MALTLPREELYSRINARVDVMMQQGLLDEARRLLPWRHLNALNTVGYKEMFAYMDHVWTLDEAVERMKGNTRRYARKQLTWFKRDQQMKWFHPDEQEQIMKYISEYE
jgi:tRNA dimethylallyltransferase